MKKSKARPLYEIDSKPFSNRIEWHPNSPFFWCTLTSQNDTMLYLQSLVLCKFQREREGEMEESSQGRMVKFNLNILDIFTVSLVWPHICCEVLVLQLFQGQFGLTSTQALASVSVQFYQDLALLGKCILPDEALTTYSVAF